MGITQLTANYSLYAFRIGRLVRFSLLLLSGWRSSDLTVDIVIESIVFGVSISAMPTSASISDISPEVMF